MENMNYMNDFLLIGAAIILFSMAIYSLLYRKVPGALPLFVQMTAAFLWTMGSYLEIRSIGLEYKIIWRNIQQIGVFIVPISSVFFAIDYSKQVKLKKYACIIGTVPIMALILIFTNRFHHLMRSGYELVESSSLRASLIVHSTSLGIILVTINFFIQLIGVIILVDFRKRVPKYFKNQVFLIILSIFLTPFLDWLKGAWLDKSGLYIPIAVLYIPSAFILFHCLLKYDILSITPIARDKVFEVITEGILIIDTSLNIVDRNLYMKTIMEKYFNKSEDFIGMNIYDVFGNIPEIKKLLIDKQKNSTEIQINNENGNYYLLCTKHEVNSDGNNIIGQVIIINDITDKKKYELSLKDKADKDSLTGLLNRNGFSDAFGSILRNTAIKAQPVTVFMIDIDLFKKINDSYGHINGDKVLQNFAEVLKATLRPEDVVGRIGGEEFAVVLPDIDKDKSLLIAEKIRKRVEESNLLVLDRNIINYTVSIGIADNINLNISQEELLHIADIALYRAKKSNRNCAVLYRE
ncbi:diguanylate cyclase domain protein [Clostridiales bacterium oral taxon 876 str. F0540]|nr:diguanylate cyclase domain protein [Clostridiales bacterium oral taxon 876 str. F0540]